MSLTRFVSCKERVLKEAVHELVHCKDPNCVMHLSNSILDTDRKSTNFCSKCKQKLCLEHF
ncbi:MAG TPA: hypothetical protein EYP60_01955 [bacterium (Candidatus Stahlbacteria)]|nr:hypothetical protein [Candidatus Stahlbacteria bacterium]